MAKLYGVGVGPGDPELLTLKALRILKRVPVICVPKSRYDSDSYALSIVRDVIDTKRQEIVPLVFPMSKDKDVTKKFWDESARIIEGKLKAGKDVACISIGDPLFYSTFIYVLENLKERLANLEVVVIPGVSSINASAASAILPLAKANERVAVLPATYEKDKIRDTLRDYDTIVLMKINKVFDEILAVLKDMGLKDKAVFISRCGTVEEMIVRDIETLKGKELDYLSMIIVRKHVY
ncbi:MAG: precorrin-2 C(20)-methyltransferase [Nitrospirota bacterium]|jgi:precorrin-2/cobalt-factor-2 C20-methyltransferase